MIIVCQRLTNNAALAVSNALLYGTEACFKQDMRVEDVYDVLPEDCLIRQREEADSRNRAYKQGKA